jgi:hypothetical protein
MTLKGEDREALRKYWLGEPLPAELERALHGAPAGQDEFLRQQELKEFLAELPCSSSREMRRVALLFGSAAVSRLAQLTQCENAETSRKASVDLARLCKTARQEEETERVRTAAREQGLLASALSEDEARLILSVLADAMSRAVVVEVEEDNGVDGG